jgi:hypothetical protein
LVAFSVLKFNRLESPKDSRYVAINHCDER